MALNNYADVQTALNTFVAQAKVTPGLAPHGAFWQNLDYTAFTTGNIPGVSGGPDGGGWKILVVGNAEQSNIIQILSGTGNAANDFGQMPQPNPPYDPEQATLISELTAWIDAGCPN